MSRAKNSYSLPLRIRDIVYISKTSPAHIGKLRHSIDFVCEEGTRIYAALSGLVVYVKDDSNVGGPHRRFWNEGNRIVIEHVNGEYSAYEHLVFHGSNVVCGERVRRGQFIGYSGNTGFSYGPHLHFEVFSEPDIQKSEGTTLQVFISRLIKNNRNG